MADTIDVTLAVRDAATGPIVSHLAQTGDAMKKLRGEVEGLSDSVDSTKGLGRHFTALAAHVGSSLNPALGQMAGVASILGREIGVLTVATTAYTAAVVVGVTALTNMIAKAQEAVQHQATLNAAVNQFDSSKIVGEIKKANDALELYYQRWKVFQNPGGNMSGAGAVAGGIAGAGAGALLGGGVGAVPGAAIGAAAGIFVESAVAGAGLLFGKSEAEQLHERDEARKQYLKDFFPAEVASQIAQSYSAVAGASKALTDAVSAEAERTGDLNLVFQAQGQALDALVVKHNEERKALEAKQDVEARKFKGSFGELSPEFQRSQNAEQEAMAARQAAETTGTALGYATKRRELEIAELETRRAIILAQGEYVASQDRSIVVTERELGFVDQALAKLKGRGNTEKEILETIQLRAQAITVENRRLQEATDIQVAQVQRGVVGGDAAARDAAALQVEQLRRASAIAQAEKLQNPIDRDLAVQRAAAQGDEILAKLEHARQVQTDPMRGLAAGFQEAADSAGRFGTVMKNMALDTAKGMQQAFSDGFFDVLTGNFKALPDVAKQFSNAMVRAVTDALAQVATAPILGSLKNLLGGAGLSAMALNPTAQAPLTVLGGAGSGGGGSEVVITQGGQIISAATAATAARQGGADVFGTVVATRPDSGEIGGITQQVLSRNPSLFQRFLPVAGSAAGLGVSAFSAAQNTTTPGIFTSAAMGGLAGASLGQSVATAFPSLGLSQSTAGLGGAVIGAGLDAALAINAKNQADALAAKQRQAAEVTRATAGGGALVSAAGGATDLVDLFNILTQHGSGTTGGSSAIAVPTTVMTPSGPKLIGQPNGTYPVASITDLLANPGSLQANIQAGVAPSALQGANAVTSTALQNIATGLANQFNTKQQGIGVSSLGAGPSGIQRTTTVPATLARTLPELPISVESPGFSNLTDNERALFLQSLYAVNQKRDLGLLVRDPSTNQIVSVTMMIPQSLPAPGALPAPAGNGDGSTVAGAQVSTATLLTAGGALAIGLGAQLLDPASIVNRIVGAAGGPNLATLLANLTSPGAGATALPGGALSTGAPNVLLENYGDLASALEAQGTAISTADPAASVASAGGDFGFSDAIGGILGGGSAILGLVQGANTGDPLSILKGVVQLYSAVASTAQAAGSSVLPTLGDAALAVYNTIAESAGGVIATTGTEAVAAVAGEVAAEAVGAIAGAGAVLAPVAIVLLIKGIVDIIQGIQKADAARFHARQLAIFQNATLPGIIQGVQQAPGLLKIILDPASTPDQVRAAAGKVDTALANYNASDAFFRGGMSQQAAIPAALNASLQPYLNALAYARIKAADRLGTSLGSGSGVALSYGPSAARDALLPSFLQGELQSANVYDAGSSSASFADRPLTRPADLAGLAALGLPSHRADGSPIMLSDVRNAMSPGGSFQNLTADSPFGTVSKATASQFDAALTPGNYAAGLTALGGQYGGGLNPFLTVPAVAGLFIANPQLAVALVPALATLPGFLAAPDGSGGGRVFNAATGMFEASTPSGGPSDGSSASPPGTPGVGPGGVSGDSW